MPRLHGLLVGIDTYPNPRHNLKGCVNDVTEFATYLRGRAAGDAFEAPELRVLTDAAATRAGVIDGFRNHLARARKGDVALFYYAGHGGQEHAPEIFWGIEPDRLNETLVCWDSRTPGGWDLADKELARLVAEVAAAGAHVVVILDCCHSGSGTRAALGGGDLHATAVRRIATDERRRPLASYLFADELGSRGAVEDAAAWALLPRGEHVLLAACQSDQLAKEYVADGKVHGTFSYFLRRVLTESKRSPSYAELIARIRARVESHKADQRPLLEVTGDAALQQTFLGGAVADRPPLLVYFDRNAGAWTLDAGAVHGVPAPEGGERARLALFVIDAPADALRDPGRAEAQALVREVHPDRSLLELEPGADLDPDAQYRAVLTALPLPPLPVRFEGDPDGVAAARRALERASPGGSPSLYLREDAAAPRYRLLARGGSYRVAQTADDRPLVREIDGGYGDAEAARAIGNLEHIARWHKIAELANPDSRIEADAVELVLDGESVADGSRTLHYRWEGGAWRQPSFRLRLRNRGERRVYCALFDLSESYAVGASLLPGGGVWLEPGEEIDAYEGRPIPTGVPDALWEAGITERRDVLKLIASHSAFNAQLLQQRRLEQPRTVTRSLGGAAGTLERLMARVQTRELGDDAAVESYDDWTSRELVIVTVRPRDEVPVPREGSAPLGFGVAVGAHPVLTARARLTSEPEVGRGYREQGLGALVAPDLFGQDPEHSRPLFFTGARGQDPGLSVLELSGVENHDAVTAEQPLELRLEVELEEDEHLLPVAFDGEFFVPLGHVAASAPGGDGTRAGGTRVVLERLPDPAALESRSLGGSIRILFQKFVARVFPSAYQHPLLAVVELGEDAEVDYDVDPERVAAAVADADRILLYVHGIIGDTRGLAASAQLATVERGGRSAPLGEHYDLVLAFDYENLETPIGDTARALGDRLEAAGLGAGSGKTLDVVAHSMGGLVSRWFVEKLGGHEVVNHLVMVGTPNAGSEWSSVQEWATTGIALVLNRVSAVFWPARVLAGLTALLERVDRTLDQMRPGSAFLRELAALPDPGVRYTILAGDTTLIAPDPAAHEARASRIGRLLAKLHLRQRTYEALTTAVFKQPNDIAVTVASIASVRDDPVVRPVASDHISYFHSEAGLAALSEALLSPPRSGP